MLTFDQFKATAVEMSIDALCEKIGVDEDYYEGCAYVGAVVYVDCLHMEILPDGGKTSLMLERDEWIEDRETNAAALYTLWYASECTDGKLTPAELHHVFDVWRNWRGYPKKSATDLLADLPDDRGGWDRTFLEWVERVSKENAGVSHFSSFVAEGYDNAETFHALEQRLAPYGLTDSSWKNDAAPSLAKMRTSDGEYVTVFVDWKDPEQREIPGIKMFGCSYGDEGEGLATDDFEAVVAWVADHMGDETPFAFSDDMGTEELQDAYGHWLHAVGEEDATIEQMQARDDLPADMRAWLDRFETAYKAAENREDRDLNVEKIAAAFVDEIRDEIGFFDLVAVDRINEERNDATCATHDFCDANMPMDEAFQKVMGRSSLPEEGGMSEDDCALWNDAWARAKSIGFSPLTAARRALDDLRKDCADGDGVWDTAARLRSIETAIAGVEAAQKWEA